jgi:tripeptidyl-peptidase-2
VEARLALEASAPWVTGPTSLLLHAAPRTFELRVDPTSLPPGLHTAQLRVMDTTARWRGPLAVLPITVIRPLQVSV